MRGAILLFIFAVVNDLFFAERIENALGQIGHQGRVVDLSMEDAPSIPPQSNLILVDLEGGEAAMHVVRSAKSAGFPVLAFGPHTDLALRESALAAGATQVVAKSKLTTSFAELVNGLAR